MLTVCCDRLRFRNRFDQHRQYCHYADRDSQRSSPLSSFTVHISDDLSCRTSNECEKCPDSPAPFLFFDKELVSSARPFAKLKLTYTMTGITEDSSALVPGDLIDVSEASLHTFPADLVLLSGDAIVNESMLTGESVPVSKIPVEEDAVRLINFAGGDVPHELSKHVLFSGTKIVRVRKTVVPGSTGEAEATAMVLRTGQFYFHFVERC